MAISILTHNIEILTNLTKSDIKRLDKDDQLLLQKVLMTSSKVSRCLVLLELGIMSIEYILKQKRIMFLHHLLSAEDNLISKQIIKCQMESPKTGDWLLMVQQDLKDVKISLTYDDIATVSKQRFKKLVKNACQKACFSSLLREKQKLSKGKEISYTNFEMQKYFQPGQNLNTDSVRKIFRIRSRDLPIKGNFPNNHSDLTCPMMECNEVENQRHLWKCQFLSAKNTLCMSGSEYDDIFGDDVGKQKTVMMIIFKRLEIRNKSCNISAHEPRGRSAGLQLVIREARRGSRRKKQDKRIKKLSKS